MGYRPRSWGRFGRVPDPPEPPEDDDRKCMRCKHCIKREGPGWANPYGCDAWTCEFEEKEEEESEVKTAIATGMNMNYLPQIRSITVRTEDAHGHKTLSLADDKAGMMLQVVLTPEVEKILKELIG